MLLSMKAFAHRFSAAVGAVVVDEPEQLRVAIVDRSNVAKSTLFNRLMARAVLGLGGARQALVLPSPHTTRDVQRAAGAYADAEFELCDTAGVRWTLRTPPTEQQDPSLRTMTSH